MEDVRQKINLNASPNTKEEICNYREIQTYIK